jgi:hypothetical protein
MRIRYRRDGLRRHGAGVGFSSAAYELVFAPSFEISVDFSPYDSFKRSNAGVSTDLSFLLAIFRDSPQA